MTSNIFWKLLPCSIRVRIESSQTIQNILANTGWLLVDKIFRLGLGLFVGVWIARYLGPQQFGALNFAIAFISMFEALGKLGLDDLVVRDLVAHPELKEEILGTTLALRLMSGSLTLALAVTCISWLRPGDDLMLWLVVIVGVQLIFRAFDAIDFWFQSLVQSKYVVWVWTGAFLLTSIFKILLILISASLIAFAWGVMLETGLIALGLVLVYRMKGYSLALWRARLKQARYLLRESWPLIFSGLMVMIYMRIDQIMLGQMIGDEAVGIFSAAVRLSEIWYFIPTIIAISIFPALIKSKESGEDIYLSRFQSFFDLNALLAYGLALPSTLLAPSLISFLYGQSYKGAETIFAIHIWACLFVFLGVARHRYLIIEGLIKFSMFATLLGAFCNIALNLVLIPKYHANGAALATLISQFISSYFSSFLLSQTRCVGILQTKAFFLPFRFFYTKLKNV